jgi:hypothetical protein
MTEPTIGRVVHVHNRPGSLDPTQPEAATIAFVHSPGIINVGGVNHNGEPFWLTSVEFHEEGSTTTPAPEYTWARFPPRF